MTSNPPVEICCPQCGYDLRTLPERRCPECGFHYDQEGIRSLNRGWCAECLQELRCAAALQAIAYGALLPFYLCEMRISLVIWTVLTMTMLLPVGLAIWFFGAMAPGMIADGLYRLARGLSVWLIGLLMALLAALVFDLGGVLFRILLPATGLVIGLLAWRNYHQGRKLNRQIGLAPAVVHTLRQWSRANLILLGVSLAVIILAWFA